jgi:hypothetical protein
MSGAIPPFPNTTSWRGAQLKKMHRSNFTFLVLPFTGEAPKYVGLCNAALCKCCVFLM